MGGVDAYIDGDIGKLINLRDGYEMQLILVEVVGKVKFCLSLFVLPF